MRILILASHYLNLRILRRELIQELSKKHEVITAFPQGEDEYMREILDNYGASKIVYVKNLDRRAINPIKDLKLLKEYKNIIKKIKPDRVITYTIKANVYGAQACKKLGVPCFVNITGLGTVFNNGFLMKKTAVALYKLTMNKVKTAFFENEENRQTIIKYGALKEEQTHLLNGAGVNLEEYPFTEYPPDDGKIRFLFFARILKDKGVDELFSAIERLSKEYNNLQFDFAGMYEEGYEKIVKELEEKNLIIYHGFQKDMLPLIQQSNCVILPSYHEGMANALLESAAVGRPLIATDIHGCKETLINGKSGLLCKPQDEDDLYLKIKEFIKLPYSQKAHMGYIGRKHMEEHFDKYTIVDETMNIVLQN